MAIVAGVHGVYVNQVFKWRNVLKRGELNESAGASKALLPGTVSAPPELVSATAEIDAKEHFELSDLIHVGYPGKAMIRWSSEPILF